MEQGLVTFGPVHPLTLIQAVREDVFALYQKKGIEPATRDATLSDILLWAEEYASQHNGQIGLSQVHWISRHLCAAILRLGRLQFEPKAFCAPFLVYEDGEQMITLAKQGLFCDAAGYLCKEDSASFQTECSTNGDSVWAHLVDPVTGSIADKPQWFECTTDQIILDEDTQVLHVHIPKGGSLDDKSVEASFSAAKTGFQTIKFCVCSSWLLDPNLEMVAPPQSNIIRFMQRFSKFPVAFEVPQIYERVFGFALDEQGVRSFNSTTSLQRNVQEALNKGTIFRTMGGYCTC